MSFRDPDVELNLVGWPAVIVVAGLVISFLSILLGLANSLMEKML